MSVFRAGGSGRKWWGIWNRRVRRYPRGMIKTGAWEAAMAVSAGEFRITQMDFEDLTGKRKSQGV